ncbi:MAG: hypothetical protein CO187_01745 [Zetaproteobacteria bacterium CG_4_9_14_3_um_filter_53_7]|nr:MAG: hypothetical protein CO187_01745 [Zetaproteobacteria bacterium CG_4_9_14_3_um_filter_53_7]
MIHTLFAMFKLRPKCNNDKRGAPEGMRYKIMEAACMAFSRGGVFLLSQDGFHRRRTSECFFERGILIDRDGL